MYYHIKYRKKSSIKTKCYRRDGKILVFNNRNSALDFIKDLEDENFVCKLIKSEFKSNNRKSPIWRKDFELVS